LFEAVGKLGGQGTGNSKARRQTLEGRLEGSKDRAAKELWVRRVFAKAVLC
jgi:hypothetical protein